MAHQLGPPLPRQHLHIHHDIHGHNQSESQSQSQSQSYSLSHQCIIEAHPFLMNVLSKIYMAHHCLQLSTEARFTSFQLFHRCLSHYIYYSHITGIDPKEQATHGLDGGAVAAAAVSSLSIQQKEEISNFACAAIFLSCKLCNEHRRIRDVINVQKVFHMNHDNHDFISSLHEFSKVEPPALDEDYWKKKEEIVEAEQLLLRTIHFDVTLYYPHRIMIVLWEELVSCNIIGKRSNDDDDNDDESNNDKQSLICRHVWKQVLHAAWRRLNDVVFHVDSLMCHSSWLACAALSLAMEEEQVTAPEPWWEWLDVDIVQLKETRDKLLYASKIPRIQFV